MVGLFFDKVRFGAVYALQTLLLWPVRRKPLVYTFPDSANLSDLVEQYRHELKRRGGRCYIIGRGPSLDRFDCSAVTDGLTFCINAAFSAMSKPDLVFFHDDNMLTSASAVLASGAKLLLPMDINMTSGNHLLVEEFLRGSDREDCIFYRGHQFAPFHANDLDNNSLLTMSGTVHSAISFAQKIGVKEICFVGIDGGTSGGKVFSTNFDQRKCILRHRLIYRKIRFDCMVLCRYLGIGYRFL